MGKRSSQFDEQSEANWPRLREELRTKRYRRQPARRVWIPKPGTTEKRPLEFHGEFILHLVQYRVGLGWVDPI